MKNILALLLVVLCSGTPSFAADITEGFLQYRWGEKISAHDGMVKLHGEEEVAYYGSSKEAYTIDGITIDDVIYGTYKEQLFAVFIGIDDLMLYDRINNYLKQKYGFPAIKISSTEYVTTRKWKYKNVTIKLKAYTAEDTMKLGIYHTSLSREVNTVEIDDLTESSYRFFPIDQRKKPKMIPFLEF